MSQGRVLVVIPAHNEERTIGEVVTRTRQALPGVDLLVVNDGSTDGTQDVLDRENVLTARHLCNLGYGRTLQTAIEYARRAHYDALVKIDADGQHAPEQLPQILEEFMAGDWDLLIGSRCLEGRRYAGAPLGRRVGMRLFSFLVKILTGQRIYDTTSGMKVIRRDVFEPLSQWHFVHFHAETIVYLCRLGYRVGESPISIVERAHGESMYVPVSHIAYPLKTSILILLGVLQAGMGRKRKREQ